MRTPKELGRLDLEIIAIKVQEGIEQKYGPIENIAPRDVLFDLLKLTYKAVREQIEREDIK